MESLDALLSFPDAKPNEDDNSFSIVNEVIGPYEFQIVSAEDDFNSNKKTLFATMVWTGARVLSNYLLTNVSSEIENKSVIELGAGSGLPSMVCRKIGSKVICSSDYPAPTVLQTLHKNCLLNSNKSGHNYLYGIDNIIMNEGVTESDNSCKSSCDSTYNTVSNIYSETNNSIVRLTSKDCDIHVIGYIWGNDVNLLLKPTNGEQYDVVIASECLWKADEHYSLINSICKLLKIGGKIFISFSHHMPGNEEIDLNFFKLAEERGLFTVKTSCINAPYMWDPSKLVPLYVYELVKQ